MSTGDQPDDSAEEMSASLPPLKRSRDIFDGLVKKIKFPKSWGVIYPEEGQTAAQAPADYITVFWDYFTEGNFWLPVTRFFLNILDYYKFHISQLNPMRTVQTRHFEFLCRSMHIEPTVDRFQVFYQLHCAQGFYSFAQRPSAKKDYAFPSKAGVIQMKMTFRGAEDIEVETLKTPDTETWYQDMKDVPFIELPERALVAAGMSLHWKSDRHDKPVYVEDDKSVNEEPWYHQIVRNYALPRDADLSSQPSTDVGELTNLGVGPKSKKKKRAPATTIAPKKFDTLKANALREEKKKGTRLVSDPCCEEAKTGASRHHINSVANPDDPIEVDSSPEPLLRTKAVKRKQPEGGAVAQPVKKIGRKKIGKKGNLDAFVAKFSLEKPIPPVQQESSSIFNDDLPPSSPHASIKEQWEGTQTVEAGVEKAVEVEKIVEVELEVEKGSVVYDVDDSPIRPDETPGDYYYRTYSDKRAFEIYAPVWKLKQADTFSDWQVYHDWLQGIFPPAEVKF
ncbi:hypothetical protein Hanom_Chr17g01524421 [Helianthus anomalus]